MRDELSGAGSWWDDPWCVGGDFNVVCFPSKRLSTEMFCPAMQEFYEFRLVDAPLLGGWYTWGWYTSSNNREVVLSS